MRLSSYVMEIKKDFLKILCLTIFIAFLAVGCSQDVEESDDSIEVDEEFEQDLDTEEIDEVETEEESFNVDEMDELQRYIYLSAEMTCMMFTDEEFMFSEDRQLEVAQKYGFSSLDEFDELEGEYSEEMVGEEYLAFLEDNCPEVVEMLEQMGLEEDIGFNFE